MIRTIYEINISVNLDSTSFQFQFLTEDNSTKDLQQSVISTKFGPFSALYRKTLLEFDPKLSGQTSHISIQAAELSAGGWQHSLNLVSSSYVHPLSRARICKPFKEPRNRFPAWRAGMTALLLVPARQATQAGEIDSSESIPGLLERLQLRACTLPTLLVPREFPPPPTPSAPLPTTLRSLFCQRELPWKKTGKLQSDVLTLSNVGFSLKINFTLASYRSFDHKTQCYRQHFIIHAYSE